MIDGLSWDKRNCSSGERSLAFREWKHSRVKLHFKNYSKCVEWNRKGWIQTHEATNWEFKLEHKVVFSSASSHEFFLAITFQIFQRSRRFHFIIINQIKEDLRQKRHPEAHEFLLLSNKRVKLEGKKVFSQHKQ